MFERILVAVDGSQDSMKAADMAVDLANRSKASLFVINVVPSAMYAESGPGAAAVGGVPSHMVDKAKTQAEAFVQQIVTKAEAQGVKVRGEIVENVPSVVDAIVDNAQEWKVDLILVGTRGLTGLKKVLLGSVSASLVHKAQCSVLVVR